MIKGDACVAFFMIKEKNKFNESINIINDSVGSKFLYDFYCDNFPFSVNCENKITDNIYIPINKFLLNILIAGRNRLNPNGFDIFL